MSHTDALGGVLLTFGVAALLLALPTAAGICTATGLLLLLTAHHPREEPRHDLPGHRDPARR